MYVASQGSLAWTSRPCRYQRSKAWTAKPCRLCRARHKRQTSSTRYGFWRRSAPFNITWRHSPLARRPTWLLATRDTSAAFSRAWPRRGSRARSAPPISLRPGRRVIGVPDRTPSRPSGRACARGSRLSQTALARNSSPASGLSNQGSSPMASCGRFSAGSRSGGRPRRADWSSRRRHRTLRRRPWGAPGPSSCLPPECPGGTRRPPHTNPAVDAAGPMDAQTHPPVLATPRSRDFAQRPPPSSSSFLRSRSEGLTRRQSIRCPPSYVTANITHAAGLHASELCGATPRTLVHSFLRQHGAQM